jgi:hypothetical protein
MRSKKKKLIDATDLLQHFSHVAVVLFDDHEIDAQTTSIIYVMAMQRLQIAYQDEW